MGQSALATLDIAHARLSPEFRPELEALAYLDPTRDGFFAIGVKSGRKKYKQRCFPLSQLPEVLESYRAANADVYVSQSEFWAPSREKKFVKRLTACFLDLDTYKEAEFRELPAESLCALVLDHCYQSSIPEPSLVVFSGRGLQLKWCFTSPIPEGALERWEAVQQELCAAFKRYHADPVALSASQVLRVVSTVNQISGETVRVLHQAKTPAMGGARMANNLIGYQFDEFADTVLPVRRDELTTPQREPSMVQSPAANDSCAPTCFLTSRGLAQRRFEDVIRLVERRGWFKQGAPDGSRDTVIFVCAALLAQAAPNISYFENEVKTLAGLLAPHWSHARLRSCVSAVKKRLAAALEGKLIVFRGKSVDPRYRFRTATLLKWLQVTDSEQRVMATLVGANERRHRSSLRKARWRKAARESGKLLTREQWLRTHHRRGLAATELRKKGLPWKQVAAELGYDTASAAAKASKSIGTRRSK
jgi:hypothetical protein